MADKEFVVTHARARSPITVKGKSLKEALEKEGLDPSIWKEVDRPDFLPPPPPDDLPPDSVP